jgi:hypothetical protein
LLVEWLLFVCLFSGGGIVQGEEMSVAQTVEERTKGSEGGGGWETVSTCDDYACNHGNDGAALKFFFEIRGLHIHQHIRALLPAGLGIFCVIVIERWWWRPVFLVCSSLRLKSGPPHAAALKALGETDSEIATILWLCEALSVRVKSPREKRTVFSVGRKPCMGTIFSAPAAAQPLILR